MRVFITICMLILVFALVCSSGFAQAAEEQPTAGRCAFTWGVAEKRPATTLKTDNGTGTLSLAGKTPGLYLRLNGCQQVYLFWQDTKEGFRILASPQQSPLSDESSLLALPSSSGTLYIAAASDRQPKLEKLAAEAAAAKGAGLKKAVAALRDELRRLQRAGSGLSNTAPRPVLVAGVSKGLAANIPAGGALAEGEGFVSRTIRLERR